MTTLLVHRDQDLSMSSSSENGAETETPGDASSQHENSDSRSPNPLPQSPSQNLQQSKLKSDEQNDLNISKCTSPNGCRTPEGVLTPPNEGDVDDFAVSAEDESKANKPNGRLKFFKDGMLCLELSHHDEGQHTKWVQVRRKTGNPQVVQVLKEAVIPYQLTQPLISTPSNSNHAQSVSRVESSTSHSMSDDGSSMLSSASPRVRDSTCRKQALPQRCTSIDSDFYMKPASCVVSLTFRHEVYVKARLCTIRRPYSMPDFVDIFREKVVPSVSKSGLNTTSGCSCLSDSLSIGKCKKDYESLKRDELNKKASMQIIQNRLSELVENKMKHKREKDSRPNNFISNGFNQSSLRTPLLKASSTKSSRTEIRDRDKLFVLRPNSSKKSKHKISEKTILSVPGHGTIFKDFKRREPDFDSKNRNLSLTSPINFSLPSKSRAIYGGEDTTDGKSNRVSNKHSPKMRPSHREAKSPNNDIRLGTTNSAAKFSSSSTSLLKSNSTLASGNLTNADYTYRLHSLPEQNMKSAMPYSPPLNSSNYATKSQADESDDDGYVQKQTVSKVISYTINSLLGTDNSNGTSTKNNKFSDVRNHRFSGSNNCFGSPSAMELSTKRVSPDADKNKELSRKNSQTFGTSDQDQSSFLRHLLDTSDPIPSPSTARAATPPSNKIPPTPPKKRSAINNHINVNTTPSKSGSSPNSQTRNSESKSILINKPVPNSRLSSFNGSKRSIQESSNAAAVSAYHHYTSLLPATFIPSLNSGNSYFSSPESRTMQSIPRPMPHLGYSGDTALNLSHRGGGWSPYLLPPLPFSSFQDRASNECQDLSMNRRSLSPFSGNHPSSAITDSDLPLNLCKKPRPN